MFRPSENLYWRSRDEYEGPGTVSGPCTAGFEPLQDMPKARVKMTRKTLADGRVEVTLKNSSSRIAFFNRLQLRDPDGNPIHGTLYSDNFFSLLPYQTKTVYLVPGASARSCEVFLEGWNLQ